MAMPFYKKMTGVPPGPVAALWRRALAALLAAGVGVGLSYYWRVFYALDARELLSPLHITLLGLVAGLLLYLGGALVHCFKGFAAKGTACILLCGLLFAFSNPPMQTPDESVHYLRTYAISQGHFDFDAARGYPSDVTALYNAFPGAWVNAHTSIGAGFEDEDTVKMYDTTGYALKQYSSSPQVTSVADSFESYLLYADPTPVTEPISFLILPFLPGALGMALARLFGFGALGCLYGGRIANLLAYTALCAFALKKAERCRPVLLGVMLLPISLYMGASLSYDATLLACYYLMLALLTRKSWDTRTVAIYAAACVYVNSVKPWLSLLWVVLPLLVAPENWHAKGRRRVWVPGMLAGALGATLLVEWYGTAFRYNYEVIARQGGEAVNGMQQLLFVLGNPLRTIASFWGTLCENDFFIGQTGLFGWKDLPIAFLSLTGPLVLLLATALAAATDAEPPLARRRTAGLGAFAAVYTLGAMAAMYITYTPVGMVRIVGLQTRYFLAVYCILMLLAAVPLRKLLRPQSAQKTGHAALLLCGGYAALGALLLFQHYFIGPVYIIPAG